MGYQDGRSYLNCFLILEEDESTYLATNGSIYSEHNQYRDGVLIESNGSFLVETEFKWGSGTWSIANDSIYFNAEENDIDNRAFRVLQYTNETLIIEQQEILEYYDNDNDPHIRIETKRYTFTKR